MNSNDLDLGALYQPTLDALRAYNAFIPSHTILGERLPPFQFTPQKPYTARTTALVYRGEEHVADMPILVFLPQDGTGDTSTYQLDAVVIPDFLKHAEKPERVLPRAKAGVIAEGFFPLFSVRNRITYPFTCSLEELTVGVPDAMALSGHRPSVDQAWNLGMDTNHFRWHTGEGYKNGYRVDPKVTATVGNYHRRRFGDSHTVGSSGGRRFGDPHAIYAGLDEPNVIQVAGFLGVTEKTPSLAEAVHRWSLPSFQ